MTHSCPKSSKLSERSVPLLIKKFEEIGVAVKGFVDVNEAMTQIKQLKKENKFRGVIVGGDEREEYCGASCTKKHPKDLHKSETKMNKLKMTSSKQN